MAYFHQYLNVLTDHKHEIRDEAFRLRYQVYCLETGFENSSAFSSGREQDQFDPHAVHGVIKNRSCGTGMATVRLVTRPLGNFHARFPIEHQYPGLFARHGVCDRRLPRRSTGEISRFAISKDISQRIGGPKPGPMHRSSLTSEATAKTWRYNSRRCPLITFGLFLALVRMSEKNDISHWVAVMEPALLRLLSRFGIHFTPIGGLVKYHGWRQPCYGRVDRVLAGIRNQQFDLWQLITDSGTSNTPARKVAGGY